MNKPQSHQELICRWLMYGAYDDKYFIALYEALAGKADSQSSKGRGGPLLAFIIGKLFSTNKREDAEIVINEVFSRFFRAIQQRSGVYGQIKDLVLLPNPSIAGEFRQAQAKQWTGKVSNWADDAMAFCQKQSGKTCDESLGTKVEAVNQGLNPLLDNGISLLAWVHLIGAGAEAVTDDSEPEEFDDLDDEEESAQTAAARKQAITELLKKIVKLIPEDDGLFAKDLGAILRLSPKLRIPTKNLIYEIARREAVNINRNNAKQNPWDDPTKKPESLKPSDENAHPQDDEADGEIDHLKAEWVIVEEAAEETPNVISFVPSERTPDSIEELPDPDESKEQEQWEYLQVVHSLLRMPLVKAESEANKSFGKSEEKQTLEKLAKQRQRFSENMGILKLRMDGYTEEAIGERMRLTRDQVRYRLKDIKTLLASLTTND